MSAAEISLSFPCAIASGILHSTAFCCCYQNESNSAKAYPAFELFFKFVSAKNYCGGLVGEGDKESEMKERGAAEQEAG